MSGVMDWLKGTSREWTIRIDETGRRGLRENDTVTLDGTVRVIERVLECNDVAGRPGVHDYKIVVKEGM